MPASRTACEVLSPVAGIRNVAFPEPHEVEEYFSGMETDFEPGLDIPGLSLIRSGNVLGKKLEGSVSVYANSVAGEPPESQLMETIEKLQDFYGDTPFSWVVKYNGEHGYLLNALRNLGMETLTTLYGMYYVLSEGEPGKVDNSHCTVREISTREEIEELVDISCEIFNIDRVGNRDAMIREREAILANPQNRSGFSLAYLDGKPIGYSRYRISSDGRAMYLTGSGVLKSFRGRHAYLSLLENRMARAREKGCLLLVVQASEGTSKPILEKFGFETAGKYLFMGPKRRA